MNLTATVPRDLYRQDWWYRNRVCRPCRALQWLIYKGINYRAEIWLNGERLAGNRAVAGMYHEFEFNVTGKVKAGAANILAVRVTPEQAFQDIIITAWSWLIAGTSGSTGSTWDSSSGIGVPESRSCPTEMHRREWTDSGVGSAGVLQGIHF